MDELMEQMGGSAAATHQSLDGFLEDIMTAGPSTQQDVPSDNVMQQANTPDVIILDSPAPGLLDSPAPAQASVESQLRAPSTPNLTTEVMDPSSSMTALIKLRMVPGRPDLWGEVDQTQNTCTALYLREMDTEEEEKEDEEGASSAPYSHIKLR